MTRFSAFCGWAVPAASVGRRKESRFPRNGGGGDELSPLPALSPLPLHLGGKYLEQQNYFIISDI